MSVESYLESIRKNTKSNADRTSSLDSTIKDLLNYESIKRAVSDGIVDGSKEEFKKLAELSKKVLTSSDASATELKAIRSLLAMFYQQIPKNSSGNTSVSAETWIKALKEVLDEFGDSLPLKFQNRLKHDIVSSAAQAGADPKQVFQQLNVTQVNQTLVLQNIYEFMQDRELKLERKAEADKPKIEQEKKDQENFWQVNIGKMLGLLGSLAKGLGTGSKWLGAIAVGYGLWNQLSDTAKNVLRGFSLAGLVFKGLPVKVLDWFKNIFGKVSGLVKNLASKFSGSKLVASIKSLFSGAKNAITGSKAFGFVSSIGDKIKTAFSGSKFKGILDGIGGFMKKLAPKIFTGLKAALNNPIFKNISKIFAPMLRAFGRFSGIGTAIMAVFDFIDGFTKTEGNFLNKMVGGLKNIIIAPLKAIRDLILMGAEWIGKLFALIGKTVTDNFSNGLSSMGQIFTGFVSTVADTLTTLIDNVKKTFEDARDKFLFWKNQDPSTSAAVPQSAPKTATKGINLRAGVKVSQHVADFIKNAGITDAISSGIRKPTNDRDWTGGKRGVGQVSAKSHASGNKFDIAMGGKSAKDLASTLEKLLRTPGFVQAGVEGSGKSWENAYWQALGILKQKGFKSSDLSKIKWWGTTYATGRHIDVLVDKSKIEASTPASKTAPKSSSKIATSVKNVGAPKASAISATSSGISESVSSGPVYNEQSTLTGNKVKAPVTKTSTPAPKVASLMSVPAGSGGNALSFNKKTDISSDGVSILRLMGRA